MASEEGKCLLRLQGKSSGMQTSKQKDKHPGFSTDQEATSAGTNSAYLATQTPSRPAGLVPALSPASYTSWDQLLNRQLPHFSLWYRDRSSNFLWKLLRVAKAAYESGIWGQWELSRILSGTVLHYYHRFKIPTQKIEELLFLVPPNLRLPILREKEAKTKRSWDHAAMKLIRKIMQLQTTWPGYVAVLEMFRAFLQARVGLRSPHSWNPREQCPNASFFALMLPSKGYTLAFSGSTRE